MNKGIKPQKILIIERESNLGGIPRLYSKSKFDKPTFFMKNKFIYGAEFAEILRQ